MIGFDSDISSLKATLNVCKYAVGERINVIYGLISEQSLQTTTLEEAFVQTRQTLHASGATGELGTATYANLDTVAKDTPIYAIDDLFSGELVPDNVLIKCDIKGAELFAMRGAKNFLLKHQPAMLISVHPDILPVFNCSVEGVRAFLTEIGYLISVIDIDHEEHWWCMPEE
ncbi:FkbM family methyltransferase [Mucilaginibacter sp. BJC16-A38]|uniref:FkbM family methyltransferase n=1 Tax=Mucilaginibacter phenanthrenivorans TaxID=1234842 RepID=UPI0021589BA9|nr:FkbM family methyltransferase [Mucilaginibacter phenanthrenivorans]MCR8560160.1 FkbM family methyltransferase [Mucilaginibacter phenanthrenivorans]